MGKENYTPLNDCVYHNMIRIFLVAIFCLQLYSQIEHKRDQTPAEKLICSNGELSKLDVRLNVIYSRIVKHTFNIRLLKQEQRWWIKDRRGKTDSVEMMQKIYLKRIEQLERWFRYSSEWNGHYNHIAFYVDQPPTNILTDLSVGKAVEDLVGKDFALLEANLSTSAGFKQISNNCILGAGCAPHLCSIAEAIIEICSDGKIHIAILNNEKILYYSNEMTNLNELPSSINSFVEKFKNCPISIVNAGQRQEVNK